MASTEHQIVLAAVASIASGTRAAARARYVDALREAIDCENPTPQVLRAFLPNVHVYVTLVETGPDTAPSVRLEDWLAAEDETFGDGVTLAQASVTAIGARNVLAVVADLLIDRLVKIGAPV